MGARSVGACPEDAKWRIRRTRLKDPGLTPETWPRWYKPDDYLVGNVDPSRIILDRRLTSFLKKSIEVRLFWSSVSIKLDGLRMLEVRRPIANFL